MSFEGLQKQRHENSDKNIVTNNTTYDALKNTDHAIDKRISEIHVPSTVSTIESIEDQNLEKFTFQSPLFKELSQKSEESSCIISNPAEDAKKLRFDTSIAYESAMIPIENELCILIDSLIDLEKLSRLKFIVQANNKPHIEVLTGDENPIRLNLSNICKDFLKDKNEFTLDFRILLCNALISRIIGTLASDASGQDQDSWIETSKSPQFEIIEATMRGELFRILLQQQYTQINAHFQNCGQFQPDLYQNHSSLFAFLTKNGFYSSPIEDFMRLMVPSDLKYAQNLAKLRTDSTKPYQLEPLLIATSLIGDQNEIIALRDLLSKNDISTFNSQNVRQNHPIHLHLSEMCTKFITSYTEWDMGDKVVECEKFVYEVMEAVINEEAFIRNSDFSTVAKQPCFESIEIALRTHLGRLILIQQQKQINESFKKSKAFPTDLDTRKTALDRFVTKHGFYHSPLTHEPLIPYSDLNPIVLECISVAPMAPSLDINIAACEQFISNKSKALKLEGSKEALAYFEDNLRDGLVRKILSEQVKTFREEFQTKGTYDAERIESAANMIFKFYSKSENASLTQVQFIHKMIENALELDMSSNLPFTALNDRIKREKYAKIDALNQPKGLLSSLFSFKPVETETSIRNLADTKLESVNLAELHWNRLLTPSQPELLLKTEQADDESSNSDTSYSDGELLFKNESENDTSGRAVSNLPFNFEYSELGFVKIEDLKKVEEKRVLLSPPVIIEDYNPGAPSNINNSGNSNSDALEIIRSLPSVPSNSPAIIEPVKIRATDLTLPLVSYVNIAFAYVFSNPGSDLEKWNKLPEIVQRDVLRHCFHFGVGNCAGEAEELACRVFNSRLSTTFQNEFKKIDKKKFAPVAVGLSDHFVQTGTRLLELFYSKETVNNPGAFMQQFRTLPEEGRFFHYVYDMAKLAKIHIEDWDTEFAKYNWSRPGMMNLSIQALERCLHTTGI